MTAMSPIRTIRISRLTLLVSLLLIVVPVRGDDGPTPYPLATCIVSDEKLGEMGKPVLINHQGRQIGFCCDSCIAKFRKAPAQYLAKLPDPAAKP